MTSRLGFIIGTALYAALAFVAYVYWMPTGLEFTGDAASYNQLAVHLLNDGLFSLDGVHAFVEREPLYSAFLAAIYAVFGAENLAAIFLTQTLLYFGCCLAFVCVLDRFVTRRVTDLCFILLLISPSVMHSLLIVYREALALPIAMLLTASVLSYLYHAKWFKALVIGLFLGLLPLVYYSFIFLPVAVYGYLLWRRADWRHIAASTIIAVVILGTWGVRNLHYTGQFVIVGSVRPDILWYVRGEQAEKVHGTEPFMCLWAEYISRDWSGRSSACSYNGLANTRWPQGLLAHDPAIADAGQAKIRQHFGSYLWFSVFEIIELHLPFVGGGWPFVFHLAAAAASFIIYFGCIFALPQIFDRRFFIITIFIAYNTLVFILTDATPRYLIPVTFGYAVFAAVGYDAALSALLRLSRSSTS